VLALEIGQQEWLVHFDHSLSASLHEHSTVNALWIFQLAQLFLERSTSPPKSLGASAAKLLSEHSWPGTVRELENIIRSSSLAVRGGVINASDLQMMVTDRPSETQIEELLELDFHSAVSRFEKLLLTKTLRKTYVVSAGDHRRFTVSLAPTGEARTEDTEVTEDFW
jgi:transcriptional regulator of aromatic amino acid metabolism